MLAHDIQYNEVLKEAERDFNTPGFCFEKNQPYIPSSNNNDAYCIAFWCMYHTGKLPVKLHKSKGYTWLVQNKHFSIEKVIVENHFDHREGVKVLEII